MPDSEFRINDSTVRQGLGAGADGFDSDAGQKIAREAAQLVWDGSPEAYFVPAVRFLLDATLSVVTAPQVESQLFKDIAQREKTAGFLADYLAKVAVRNDIFGLLYKLHPTLSELRPPQSYIESLGDAGYLASLSKAPFFDVRRVAGGAFRLLKELGVGNPTGIIKRSTGLLAVAGVSKDPKSTDKAHDYLGRGYVQKQHLELNQTAKQVVVTFSKQALAALSAPDVKGRGCPAGKIDSPDRPGSRLLTDYWTRIVDYLVPVDATTQD